MYYIPGSVRLHRWVSRTAGDLPEALSILPLVLEREFISPTSCFLSPVQYLQMKWPLLDVPSSATVKDTRSPSPAHLVSLP